jgi:hypothetical protein
MQTTPCSRRSLAVPTCVLAVSFAVSTSLIAAAVPGEAWAQEAEAVAKVRDLNKKAVDAYENLELEEARKFLTEALELCAAEGLNRHAIKATTHLNLGVVLVGGLKQRDAGTKQFQRALEIDPNVKVPKRLNNPEIQAAFEQASKGGGGDVAAKPTTPAKPAATPPATAPTAPPKLPPVPATPPKPAVTPPTPAVPTPDPAASLPITLVHEPPTEAKLGTAYTVKAKVEGGGRFDRIVLAYRAEGASDFLARDMDRTPEGEYEARIPEPAMQGASVSYYLEARGRGGQALARNGTPDAPHVVALSPTGADAEVEDELPDRGGKSSGGERLWLSLGLGVGGGYTKGNPEVNKNYVNKMDMKTYPLDVSNLATANLLHFNPELGYFATDRLLLSLQGRLQLTTGASETRFEGCRPNNVCQPASGAVAVLAKATYLLGSFGAFQPYVALSAGGGYIRYLFDLSGYELDGCGANHDGKNCFDTVAGGGFLIGPSVGTWIHLTGPVFLTAQLNALFGVPKLAINADLNLGLGYRL